MIWIALALLALTTVVVGVITFDNGWGMQRWRYPRRVTPPQERQSYQAISVALSMQSLMTLPLDPRAAAIHEMGSGTFAGLLSVRRFSSFHVGACSRCSSASSCRSGL